MSLTEWFEFAAEQVHRLVHRLSRPCSYCTATTHTVMQLLHCNHPHCDAAIALQPPTLYCTALQPLQPLFSNATSALHCIATPQLLHCEQVVDSLCTCAFAVVAGLGELFSVWQCEGEDREGFESFILGAHEEVETGYVKPDDLLVHEVRQHVLRARAACVEGEGSMC